MFWKCSRLSGVQTLPIKGKITMAEYGGFCQLLYEYSFHILISIDKILLMNRPCPSWQMVTMASKLFSFLLFEESMWHGLARWL